VRDKPLGFSQGLLTLLSLGINGVGQIGNERGRGFFVQTVLAVRPQTREVPGCPTQEPGCRAFQCPNENNGINGTNGKSTKRMCGCAKYKTLALLMQEARGSMLEIEARICFRSFTPVKCG